MYFYSTTDGTCGDDRIYNSASCGYLMTQGIYDGSCQNPEAGADRTFELQEKCSSNCTWPECT